MTPQQLPDHSEISSVFPGTLPIPLEPFRFIFSLYFYYSDYSKTISKRRQDLKCVTLRFGNTPDMVETPRSPMTVRETWMAMTVPVHSRIIVVEPLNMIFIPFVPSILPSSEIRSSTSYVVFYPVTDKGYLTRSVILHLQCPSHTLRSFIDVISPSGPRVSSHHTDEQILLLITRLDYFLRIPERDTFIVTLDKT